MGIAIQGIKIETLTLNGSNPTGSYALIGSTGKTLATQPFNTYGGIEISISPATSKAIDAMLASIKADICALIGLEGEES